MTDQPAKTPRRQMNVRLPADLVDQIDERRARLDLSRDVWVERVIRHALSLKASQARTTAPGQRTAPPARNR